MCHISKDFLKLELLNEINKNYRKFFENSKLDFQSVAFWLIN